MRKLTLAFFLASTTIARAEPPVLPLPTQKITELYVVTSQMRQYGSGGVSVNCGQPANHPNPCNAVYVQTHLPAGQNEGPQTSGVPITVDLTPYLPSGVTDAKAAFLGGILVLTHGSMQETADVWVTFAPDDGSPMNCTKPLHQAIEAAVGGGQRSSSSSWVALTNNKFRFCYTVPAKPAWPTGASYGINLSLQAWGR
jgi:hypothetical protein